MVEGDLLQPGQILARFEVPELEAQRLQLEGRMRSAEADLAKAKYGNRAEEKEAARATVEAALARWKRLKAGPRTEEIKQARADLEPAEAELARQKFDRVRRLVMTTSATAEEFDSAKSAQQARKLRPVPFGPASICCWPVTEKKISTRLPPK